MSSFYEFEPLEEKEKRLEAIARLEIKKEILDKRMYELDEEIKSIIDTDEDYRKYIENWKNSGFSSRRLDYDRYCSLIKLYFSTSREDELFTNLMELLRIEPDKGSRIDENVFDEAFNGNTWNEVIKTIRRRLPDTEFKTWIRTLKPLASDEKTIRLVVENEFYKTIIEERYENMLLNSIRELTNKSYTFEYCVGE